MSLRAKILLAMAAVNLIVTVLLATFLVADLNAREQVLSRQRAQLEQEAKQALRRAFGGFLVGDSLELEGPQEPAGILRRLLQHPVRNIIDDGIVLNQYRTTPDGEIDPQGVYVNLLGAKGRAPDFAEQQVRRLIARAIESGAVIFEQGWIAAPIRLRPRHVRPGEGRPWGGGAFRLAQTLPSTTWPASFRPLTLVLGMIAGTLALVGITYWLLDRWVLRPLGRLGRGAERVAERHFDRPVPGAGEDEIGRLIQTFNGMMAEVSDAQQSLTERVEEATRRAEESRRGLVIAQRLAATGTLASGIAHEINNPLGGMLNSALRIQAEAGKRGAEPDTRMQRYASLLIRGLEQIQNTVRRVLAFSPRRTEPSRVRVREVVDGAAALARHRAGKVGVQFDISGEDAWILAEPGEFQQVFLNLFINACDAMEDAGGVIRVRIEAAAEWVEVRVHDSGRGMTEEECERAFDLFFTTKDVGRGTGLGLSVAHHIVDQHGGELSVDSAPGRGARFTVRLPTAPERG